MSMDPRSQMESMIVWTDPVVEEIHQIRQRMLADAGGDIDALLKNVHAHQAAQGGVVIEIRLPAQKADAQVRQ